MLHSLFVVFCFLLFHSYVWVSVCVCMCVCVFLPVCYFVSPVVRNRSLLLCSPVLLTGFTVRAVKTADFGGPPLNPSHPPLLLGPVGEVLCVCLMFCDVFLLRANHGDLTSQTFEPNGPSQGGITGCVFLSCHGPVLPSKSPPA